MFCYRDVVIDEERNLRKAAEETLQKYLVDLYNNPNVNSELRHRLPHAKKVDPVLQTMHAATDDTQDPTVLRDTQTTGSFNLMVGEREDDVEVSNQREAPRKRDIRYFFLKFINFFYFSVQEKSYSCMNSWHLLHT